MSNVVDPNWPRVLSLASHELRGPLAAAIGNLRIVLSERAGQISPMQRKLLDACIGSLGRLTGVADEMSDLAHIEDGERKFNRTNVDLRAVLGKAIAVLPENPHGEIAVKLSTGEGPAALSGDPERLRLAFTSIIFAIRRELVTASEVHVHERVRRDEGGRVSWIVIAGPDRVDALDAADPGGLAIFDEWRGGCGLSLPIARRIIERHGGALWSPPRDPEFDEKTDMGPRPWKAGAIAMLPHA